MRRSLAVLLILAFATPGLQGPAAAAPKQATVLVARSHFGFGRSRSFGRARRPAFGGLRRPHLPKLAKRGLLRRIAHALAFAALLHFLFHSLGGILVLIVVVVLVVVLVRALGRLRRPRY